MHNERFFNSVLEQLEQGRMEAGLHFLAGSLITPEARSAARPVLRDHELHRVLMEDPYTARAFAKPRGYAGDAVLIDMLYDREPPPETSLRGRDIFSCTTAFPVAQAVRERRDTAAQLLEQEWRSGKSICALACGHLREADALCGQDLTNIVAVDQDSESLAVVSARHEDRIRTAHANVIHYLRAAANRGESFDHIYTLGLTDYFDDRAMRLLHRLMKSCLNPGGTIRLANFIPSHIAIGWMDAVMDWHLIYRTEADLTAFAAEIGMAARSWIDSTGSIAWCEMEDRG
jgi:extracellular factor (EF) 3-hydroxypalmitic acid methyl ester biosynthesis protein